MKQYRRQVNKSAALLGGKPLPTLLGFSVPIILGNIFQQLYSIVDAIVVGRFLGELPLGGISIAAPFVDVVNALIIGATIGVGVLVGHICGAKDWARLKRVHATALLGGGAVTLAISVLGLIFGRRFLLLQGYAPLYCDEAMRYLSLILSGMICCFTYNYYASVLRSYGDSRTPFLVLLISTTLHALLDVLLVGLLNMGIRGVAISTVFCQLLSAISLIVYTYRRCPDLALSRTELRFEGRLAGQLLTYAWAASLQQATIYLGRLLVQSFLAPLGEQTVTGYNMGLRWEQFLLCFSTGISAAMVVCISQNLGHGNKSRVLRFYRAGALSMLAIVLVLASVCKAFPRQIIGLFTDSEAVLATGAMYTETMSFFYIFSFSAEVVQGYFRGIGRLRLTMFASMLQILLRIVLSSLLVPRMGITGICISVISGWALLSLIEGTYSIKTALRLRRSEAPARTA